MRHEIVELLVQAQTEYHELVLYRSQIHIINRVGQTLVQQLLMLGRGSSGQLQGFPVGFAQDIVEGILYVFTGTQIKIFYFPIPLNLLISHSVQSLVHGLST